MQLGDGENQIPVAAPDHITSFDSKAFEIGQPAVFIMLGMRVIL